MKQAIAFVFFAVFMPHCQVAACRNNSARTTGINFFCFPKAPDIRSQWIHLCDRGEKKWTPRANDRVCSVHFQADDFERDLKAELMRTPAKTKLKKSAVPSRYLSREHASPFTSPPRNKRAAISKLTHVREIEDMLSAAIPTTSSSHPHSTTKTRDSDDSMNEGVEEASFHPSASTQSSEESDNDFDGSPTVPHTSLQKNVFLIYFSELLHLLKYCPQCGSAVLSERLQHQVRGSLLRLRIKCSSNHAVVWQSQPMVANTSKPLGNVCLAAATILSGNTYTTLRDIAEPMKLAIMSEQEYCRVQREAVPPVISDAHDNVKVDVKEAVRQSNSLVLRGR